MQFIVIDQANPAANGVLIEELPDREWRVVVCYTVNEAVNWKSIPAQSRVAAEAIAVMQGARFGYGVAWVRLLGSR